MISYPEYSELSDTHGELRDMYERMWEEITSLRRRVEELGTANNAMINLRKKAITDTASKCAQIAYETVPPKSIGRDKGKHHSAGAQHAARRIEEAYSVTVCRGDHGAAD